MICNRRFHCFLGPPTVVRIHRLLRQTNDMLERLQTDFDNSLRQSTDTSLRHSTNLSPAKNALEQYSVSDESENDDLVRI